MRQAHLLQILEALYAAFPHLRQVTVYAGTRSTMTKSQEPVSYTHLDVYKRQVLK